jgi:catechol-2,3-dioxygenase
VNLAVYLRDPDGNGVELMVDRPSERWPRATDGSIAMRVDPPAGAPRRGAQLTSA